ncbi:MAG TPA: DUF4382 domain-containing protein [Candidatus Polarisedimenticolia bacterium]|nr:DUF4382 domain-containing protein [Candidatus Polarisedimenticolia bacterium]
MERPRGVLSALALLSLAAFLTACSHGAMSASVDNGKGTVNVFLTDAPLDLANVQSVNVTLTGVILYPGDAQGDSLLNDTSDEDGTPVVIVSHPATFDLLTLTGGATTLIGTDEVPAGAYSRIRLVVEEASLTYLDGTIAPLKIESGKVDVPIRFDVTRDETTGIVLDFDAAASVQVNDPAGNGLILRPVVTPKKIL